MDKVHSSRCGSELTSAGDAGGSAASPHVERVRLPWGHWNVEGVGPNAEKPANVIEVAFYQAASKGELGLEHIAPYIPEYRGVRNFPGCSTPPPYPLDSEISSPLRRPCVELGAPSQTLVLENLTAGYKPDTMSRMDIRLGTDQWGPNTSEQGKARQIRDAEISTMRTHGVRLIGAEIVSTSSDTNRKDVLDRAYGLNIRTDEDAPSSSLNSDAVRGSDGRPTWGDTFVRLYPGIDAKSTDLATDSFDTEAIKRQMHQIDKSIFGLDSLSSNLKNAKIATEKTPWELPSVSLLSVYGEPVSLSPPTSANNRATDDYPSDRRFKACAKLIDHAKVHRNTSGSPDRGVLLGYESLLKFANTRRDTLTSQRSLLENQLAQLNAATTATLD